MYDNQIGRWHVVDPLASLNYSWSPYAYASNDPAAFNDPYGLLSDSAHPVEIAPIVIKGTSKSSTLSSQPTPFLAQTDHTGVATRWQPNIADNLRLITAEEANSGFSQPAYKPGTMVQRFNFNKTAFKGRFIRVFNLRNKNANSEGGWILKEEDAKGLTPEQLKNEFSMPGQEAPDQLYL